MSIEVYQKDKMLLILCYRERMVTFMFVDIVFKLMKKVTTPAHQCSVSFKTFRDREVLYEKVPSRHSEKHLISN